MKKVLITGGHITPALAVIEELRKRGVKIVFVGRKYALDFEKTFSFEYQEIKKLGIPFFNLKAGRLTRILSWRSLLNFIKFPLGFLFSFQILRREKPDFILSFGGYLALPIAFVGWLSGIPIFTHEQTLIPGLANRIIGFFAKKIFISFSKTKEYFPKDKTIVSGNPIRSCIFKKIKQPFKIIKNKPVIYITGGSLGSHSINILFEPLLPRLLNNFIVIHQTGETEEYQDFERLSEIKHKNYFLKKHFYDDEIGFVYSLADLVVSRAGANTIFELIALKKPAILIPLPWSASGEQKAHAQLLKKKGVAEVFFQEDGRNDPSARLYRLIIKMINNLAQYQKNFIYLENYYKKDASQTIIDNIFSKD